MREIRFAVGEPERYRSTVWRLWTQKAEFYLQSRMMGSSTKVSIHSGGVGQWSMQSEWYGKNRPNQPNRARHIDRWEWSEPVGTAAARVFRLFIPNSELREIQASEDLSKVNWISAPGAGMQILLDCFVAPVPADQVPANQPGLLCALERTSETSVVVLGYGMQVSAHDLDQQQRVRAEAAAVIAREKLEVKPGYRLVALAHDDAGSRAMIEFVPEGA